MAEVTWAELMDVFFTRDIHHGWITAAPEATTIATGISEAIERIIDGWSHIVKNYIWDPFKNIGSAVRDAWQWISGIALKSQRWDYGRLKNLSLWLSGAVTNTIRATSNLALWTISATDYAYRSLADAHSEFSAWTLDRLWRVGMTFGNLRRVGIGVVWWIPWFANEVAKLTQTPLDLLHNWTRLSWRESYVAELPYRSK